MPGLPTRAQLAQMGPVKSVPRPEELEQAARVNRETKERKLFELKGLALLAENADLMFLIKQQRDQAILALLKAENSAARGLAQAWALIAERLMKATEQARDLEAELAAKR